MRKLSAAGEKFADLGVDVGFVDITEPLIDHVALRVDEHILRACYNVETLPSFQRAFIFNVEVKKIDLSGILVF